jgi:hypothetical protein
VSWEFPFPNSSRGTLNWEKAVPQDGLAISDGKNKKQQHSTGIQKMATTDWNGNNKEWNDYEIYEGVT